MARSFVRSSAEYLSLGAGLSLTPPFSVAALVNIASLSGGAADCIWSNGIDGANSGHEILVISTGVVRAFSINAGSNNGGSTSTTISTGTWNYIQCSWDATNSRSAWLNGAGKGTGTTNITNFTADEMRIGRMQEASVNKLLDGTVEYVVVWSDSITDAQAALLSKGIHPLVVKPNNVVDYWDLTRNINGLKGNNLTATGSSVVTNSGKVFYRPKNRRIFSPVSTAATEALTGQAITSAQGSVGVSVSKALTGEAITSAQGSVAASIDKALSGQAITSAQGSVTVDVTIPLTGTAITSAIGTVTPAVGIFEALTGQAITSGQGSFGVVIDKAISGESAIASQGSLTVAIDKALSGQEITSAQGSVSVAIDKALTGQEITSAQGTIGIGGDISLALTGQEITSDIGTLSVETSALVGRKSRRRKVRLWDLETITPEPVQNDPQLLQDLLLESIAIGGLAKKYAKPYTQKFDNKKRIEQLMKDHEYIKNMIAAYQAGLDEHEREDEMLLF